MSLDGMVETICQRIGEDSGLGGVIKIDLGSDGAIYIDATSVPNVVSLEPREVDCTFTLELKDLQKITDGRLGGVTAYVMGRLKISGNMSLAGKLRQRLAGDS